MGQPFNFPDDFQEHLNISNAPKRLKEALRVAGKITDAGVQLLPNPDHAAIFVDPPHLMAGPLKKLGYISGWDTRCYPSPVDGHDYINSTLRIAARQSVPKPGLVRLRRRCASCG